MILIDYIFFFFKVCKRYPGFVRVFLQDPQPERRFLRRGWVTFEHSVNVKEICWNLNNIRVSLVATLLFVHMYFFCKIANYWT